jgi:hypothetical protein
MAGDWMKFEFATLDKPELYAISRNARVTLGCAGWAVLRCWKYGHDHTTDGKISWGTVELIDTIAGIEGFGKAMEQAGWLIVKESYVQFPQWDRHNSNGAKVRQNNAVRASRFRNARVTLASRSTVTNNASTEQNRTEESAAAAEASPSETQKRNAEWIARRPEWLPEGKPWISKATAVELAALGLPKETVERIWGEAKRSRNTLNKPAGYVIAQMKKEAKQ